MNKGEIETTIQECKEMASEPTFNLVNGHTKVVNYYRYAELLEELLRVALRNVKTLEK